VDSRPTARPVRSTAWAGGQGHRPGDRYARRPPPGAARDQGEGVAQGQVVASEQVALAGAAALERKPVAAGHVGGGDHVDPRPRQVGADPAAHDREHDLAARRRPPVQRPDGRRGVDDDHVLSLARGLQCHPLARQLRALVGDAQVPRRRRVGLGARAPRDRPARGRGAGHDDAPAPTPRRGVQHRARGRDVDGLHCGHVRARVAVDRGHVQHRFAVLDRPRHRRPIAQVGGDVLGYRRLGRRLRPAQRPHLGPGVDQHTRDVRADQAARPRDEDPHRPTTARTDSLSERVVASTAVGS
jgi:hypothetical protein